MYGFGSGYESRRMTLSEYGRYFPNPQRPKTCTGHNRVVCDTPEGGKAFVLHTTAVVTLNPDGTITLDDDGWETMTTRRAMMEGIFELTGKQTSVWGNKPKSAHVLHWLGTNEKIHFTGRTTIEVPS